MEDWYTIIQYLQKYTLPFMKLEFLLPKILIEFEKISPHQFFKHLKFAKTKLKQAVNILLEINFEQKCLYKKENIFRYKTYKVSGWLLALVGGEPVIPHLGLIKLGSNVVFDIS